MRQVKGLACDVRVVWQACGLWFDMRAVDTCTVMCSAFKRSHASCLHEC